MLQYLLFKDRSITIILPSGPITIPHTTVNYRPILQLLQKAAPDEQILSLLNTPTPDGIFSAYTYKDTLYIQHIAADYSTVYYMAGKGLDHVSATIPSTAVFQGSYASKEDLISDWPEYLI